jgi:hypothetical protein
MCPAESETLPSVSPAIREAVAELRKAATAYARTQCSIHAPREMLTRDRDAMHQAEAALLEAIAGIESQAERVLEEVPPTFGVFTGEMPSDFPRKNYRYAISEYALWPIFKNARAALPSVGGTQE